MQVSIKGSHREVSHFISVNAPWLRNQIENEKQISQDAHDNRKYPPSDHVTGSRDCPCRMCGRWYHRDLMPVASLERRKQAKAHQQFYNKITFWK